MNPHTLPPPQRSVVPALVLNTFNLFLLVQLSESPSHLVGMGNVRANVNDRLGPQCVPCPGKVVLQTNSSGYPKESMQD